MSNKPFLIIAVVAGCILVMSSLLFAPVVGIIFATFVVGAGFVLQRQLDKPDKFAQQFGQADVLNRMWFPLQDELSVVVKAKGRVTEASSAWTTAPGLSKRETPETFFKGMQRYVRQREFVVSLAAGDLATEDSRRQLAEEQKRLQAMAEGLLEKVNRSIEKIPGAETAVRRTRGARPSPTAQRTRATSTRSSAVTRRPTPASRGAQAQPATSARIIRDRPAPPRPTPAPLRIADRPETSERAVPTPTRREPEPPLPPSPPPPRITYTPMPPPPVAAPPPQEPEPPPPPSARPGPSLVTESVSEPFEAAPSPSETEPAAQPNEQPDDLRLDIASVCEELFNSDMMSYATNKLFDERYKDATVRWKGTARRASTYSYDFEFGDGGGTKAELDVYEVKQQYGSRTVKVFVQLPVEAADVIGARIGEGIEFEGRLLTCEGSARRLYVADARMVN